MKQQKQALMCVILMLGIIMLSSCGMLVIKEKDTQTTIDIGVIAPLTGEAASYGLAAKQGMDFAVQEINNQGGVLGKQIQLHYGNSQFDPKQAVSLMNKFVNIDEFKIIIVADGSGPTTAVAPLADQTKTLIIATLASSPQLSPMGDYLFRTVPSDAYQGKELAKWANKQKFERAAILYVNDPYGVGIKEVFSEVFTGKIVITESFEDSADDFRTSLTKIKQKNPDVLLLVVRKELPLVLKQIKELGLKTTLVGTETTKNDELISKAGNAAEDFYSIFYAEPVDYKNYKANFKQMHGKEPESYGTYSYDAIYVLADAMQRTKSFDTTKLKDALYDTKWYGASGIVAFDVQGDVIDKPFTMFHVENGKFVAMES